MRSVRKRFKPVISKSPSLPEYSIDVNVCRNPHCENFGLSEEDITDIKNPYKNGFNSSGAPTIKCKRCTQQVMIYSI